MECIADDDNGNPLLLVTMMVLRRGVVSKIELWGKRIVGGETTQLSADETDRIDSNKASLSKSHIFQTTQS